MSEWISLVADAGFPVVVTLYLLMRIEGKLETLAVSIAELTKTILQLKA